MLIQQILLNRFILKINMLSVICHIGNSFHYNSIVHRLIRILSPGERPVLINYYTGYCNRVDVSFSESFYNNSTCFFFISSYRMELLPLGYSSPPVTVYSQMDFFLLESPLGGQSPCEKRPVPISTRYYIRSRQQSPASSLRP